jgi:signal transduction histidine kinase/ligand-binding sensor domain-containing protein/DNA-binding response OmpR family regulator
MLMKWRRLILNFFAFLFLFLWASVALRALDPDKKITQYSIKIWNMEAGLPGNSVYAVRQTQEGYLWIGTQNGLVRFDGIDFELFTRDKIPQLKDNIVRALYQDRNGTLWIGTTSGGLTLFKEEEFTFYPITKYKALSGITAIDEDQWGNMWIGSFTAGLTCMSNGKFNTYTIKDGLPDNQVRSIYKSRKGDLWVTTTAGIVKLLKPGSFQSPPLQKNLPYYTTCLYKENTGELWIGTGENGLLRLKNGKFKAEQGVLNQTITSLYEDSMENLWIGTDGGGLIRMHNGELNTLHKANGLADDYIHSIYEDREGSLWVGTLHGGLHQFRDSKFTTTTTSEGLPHDDINCIYENRAGDLWIGTKGGMGRLKNGNIDTVLTTEQRLLDNSVTCFFEDQAGNLLIGTWGGLHRLIDKNLTALTVNNRLSDKRIKCILEDSHGMIWIGTEDGLNRLDNNNGEVNVFTTEKGLSSNIIEFIFEDSKGNLRIGTNEGLNLVKDGVITASNPAARLGKNFFRCAYEDKNNVLWFGTNSGLIRLKDNKTAWYTVQDGLIENYVYSILEDDRGYLWLAGRNGISRLSKKELEDFSKGKIPQVQPDWYNEKDGMKSRWCDGAGCKTRDGKLWFPTSIGVTSIHPNRIKKNNIAPTPIIKKLIADDETIHIQTKKKEKKPLELGPGKKRLEFYYAGLSFINPGKIRYKLKLKGYDRDWVEMGNVRSTTYTRLSPGHYTFNVIAANADGVGNEKGASFSFYLRPYFTQTAWFFLLVGISVLLSAFTLYRFRVRQLKNREKELSILVDLRTRDLQERNLELEKARQNIQQSKELIEAKNLQLESQTVQLKEQSEKLKEMDKVKSRFFANISHEFRTPLTLIIGPLEQMLYDSSDNKQKKKLNLMLRNSQRLLGLINQLLELSKFESGKVKLQAGRQNIIPFLKGIVANFVPLADQRELDLTFQAEAEDITLYIDAEKLENIMSNLLINALKFTPPGGKITVTVRLDNEYFPEEINNQKFLREGPDASRGGFLEKSPPGRGGFLKISVSDTGPGISREQLVHIFDRFYQSDSAYEHREKGSGIGLALVKELVQVHHGKIDVYSREGKGTEFIITLPMGDAHLGPGEIVKQDITADVKTSVPAAVDIRVEELDEMETTEIEEDIESLQAGKEIILVVEDSADMRDYIRGALESLYSVVEAADGQEGIEKAQEIIPDLIISDIMMPVKDGYELCRTLKTNIRTSHIPVILLTAKASEESIVQGLETGADDYITKPFSTQILLARIKNLIDLRRQLHSNIDREMTLQPAKMSVSTIDKEFMKELQDVINKNLADEDFNVEQLARKLYMDRSTIYRKVLALTGEAPTDFIRSCRLKRGAELLKSNFGTVLEVALEVGFSSANYFTKCFKKKFHRLPSNYQASEGE